MPEEVAQARKVVVLALTKHEADTAQNVYDKLALLLRFGWAGYEHMDTATLLNAAESRGLNKIPEVSKALGILISH